MILPATGVEIPSEDWKISNVKVNKQASEETLSFTAIITHLPTKCKIWVKNTGTGGSHFTDFDYNHKDYRTVVEKWNEFLQECIPALRKSVANHPDPVIRGIYDGEIYGLDDDVIDLFINESEMQKTFNRRKGAIVRPDPQGQPDLLHEYKVPASVLVEKGNTTGEYWDKTVKNWVSF